MNNPYHGLNLRDSAFCKFPNDRNMMLVTGGPNSKSTYTLSYNQDSNTVSLEKLSRFTLNARTNHSLVFCGNSFFAIGGSN